uniref:TRP C-terminal domain-containing protein n=1 Tax=Amphimedon queenslandica TaxID=400682 RepID=A0A1X7TS39_AMPQE
MLTGLLYTITIFSSQWMQRLCGRYCRSSWDPFYRFKPFLDAYTGPYKDKYRYWTGLLLIVRLLLVTVFSYTTGTIPIINNYIIVFTAAILIYVLAKEVYRNKIFNRLELFYMVNLGFTALLLALMNKFEVNDAISSTTIMALSISLSMTVFICTVLVHLYNVMKKFCSSKLKFTIPFKFADPLNEEEPLLREVRDITCPLPNEALYPSVVNEREQLIFD